MSVGPVSILPASLVDCTASTLFAWIKQNEKCHDSLMFECSGIVAGKGSEKGSTVLITCT